MTPRHNARRAAPRPELRCGGPLLYVGGSAAAATTAAATPAATTVSAPAVPATTVPTARVRRVAAVRVLPVGPPTGRRDTPDGTGRTGGRSRGGTARRPPYSYAGLAKLERIEPKEQQKADRSQQPGIVLLDDRDDDRHRGQDEKHGKAHSFSVRTR